MFRWTKKIDILKKKFIFFPIHSMAHYSLAVLVNPQAANESLSKEEKVAKFFLLHFDSSKGSHDKLYIKDHFVQWLNVLLPSISGKKHDIPVCAPQGT